MKTETRTIGKVAQPFSLTWDTLRTYEKQPLLSPPGRSKSGYRIYSEYGFKTLPLILSAKNVGFTLNKMKQLLALEISKNQYSCKDVKHFVDEKIDFVAQQIASLLEIKSSSNTVSQFCCDIEESATHYTILETLNIGEPS